MTHSQQARWLKFKEPLFLDKHTRHGIMNTSKVKDLYTDLGPLNYYTHGNILAHLFNKTKNTASGKLDAELNWLESRFVNPPGSAVCHFYVRICGRTIILALNSMGKGTLRKDYRNYDKLYSYDLRSVIYLYEPAKVQHLINIGFAEEQYKCNHKNLQRADYLNETPLEVRIFDRDIIQPDYVLIGDTQPSYEKYFEPNKQRELSYYKKRQLLQMYPNTTFIEIIPNKNFEYFDLGNGATDTSKNGIKIIPEDKRSYAHLITKAAIAEFVE